jgi:glycosyltransferase involved in cell wall biosynthesis
MSSGLVVLGEDWGGHPSSTQHLVGRLAKDRDVVWVNSIGLRRPRFNARDAARAFAKLSDVARPRAMPEGETRAFPPRMSIVHPRAESWPGSAIAQVVNRASLGRQLRGALQARGMSAPILWASLPSAVSVIGAIGERAVVYYCGDDFSALTGVDHDAVAAMERDLVSRSDLILVASEELATRFPRGRTALVPHGVDFERFSRPVARANDLPSGRPVAGFYGSVADWIDIEMLARTARAMAHWNFVIIGPAQTDVSALMGLSNVHLMGPRPHDALPSYVQHFDVSLLPFRDTAQIRACNPLKLREYLAAGRPVVATDFPALDGYRDHVVVARHANDFADAIQRAASSPSDDAARRARVAGEGWDTRSYFVNDLLRAL